VTSRRLTAEEESGVGDNLVKFHVRIERNVKIEYGLAQTRDDVATHGEQQQRERERHSGGGATSQTHAVACYTAQTAMFVLYGISYSTLLLLLLLSSSSSSSDVVQRWRITVVFRTC
jgi:hypothetical protein